MVIEKVHAFHTTKQSLHERFTLLMNAGPHRVFMQRKRRASAGSIISQNYNYSNRLIDQVARRLEMQAKRQGMRQRLGFQQSGGMRRFGSESSLPGLRRSNSFGNLSQQSVKSRLSWKQSNNNLSRSASFSNLTHLAWRGKALRWFHKRGGQRVMQRRYRNGRQNGQVNGFQQRNRFQRNGFQQRRGVQQRQGFQQRRGVQQRRGFQQRRGALRKNQQQNNGQQQTRAQSQQPHTAARRGRARGRGRGGITRSQSQSQLLMTKEQLDAQLDDYMSCTKAALDQELDNYMKNAMEME